MGMFLGNINPSSFYFGDKIVTKILRNTTVVWEKNGGGEVDDVQYLCFTAEEAGSTISMFKSRTPPTVYLETSPTGEDGSWTDFIVGETTITLESVGDKVYFRAKQDNLTFSTGGWYFQKFLVNKKTKLTGSISTILTISGTEIYNAQPYWFNCLFANSYITTTTTLPATTLAIGCYRYMFDSCSYLTQAPELPATEVADDCYAGMFLNCTSLTTAPELPATELKYNCYERMFEGCTSLTQAPELKITKLAAKCIEKMFYKSGVPSFTVDMTACTSVPELPASNLFTSSIKPYTVLVPAALYDEWIQATNWSTIVSNIQAV